MPEVKYILEVNPEHALVKRMADGRSITILRCSKPTACT
ncbi:Chaperone protein HtpG [Vibrio cholerae]|nr:Chaperone protein HtpG [Vibrio cholerae]